MTLCRVPAFQDTAARGICAMILMRAGSVCDCYILRSLSKLVALIEHGHFDARIFQAGAKALHGIRIAMNQKRYARFAGLAMPRQQLRLVCVSRKSIDCVNVGSDRNLFSEQTHLFRAVDDDTRKGPLSRISHEDDAAIGTGQILPEVMTDSPAGAHSRSRHDQSSR